MLAPEGKLNRKRILVSVLFVFLDGFRRTTLLAHPHLRVVVLKEFSQDLNPRDPPRQKARHHTNDLI